MATADQLGAWLAALEAQRASGVAKVSYDGRSVEYRGLAEIDRAIAALKAELAGTGRRPRRIVYLYQDGKGL